jgi:hypothetical protein
LPEDVQARLKWSPWKGGYSQGYRGFGSPPSLQQFCKHKTIAVGQTSIHGHEYYLESLQTFLDKFLPAVMGDIALMIETLCLRKVIDDAIQGGPLE